MVEGGKGARRGDTEMSGRCEGGRQRGARSRRAHYLASDDGLSLRGRPGGPWTSGGVLRGHGKKGGVLETDGRAGAGDDRAILLDPLALLFLLQPGLFLQPFLLLH